MPRSQALTLTNAYNAVLCTGFVYLIKKGKSIIVMHNVNLLNILFNILVYLSVFFCCFSSLWFLDILDSFLHLPVFILVLFAIRLA